MGVLSKSDVLEKCLKLYYNEHVTDVIDLMRKDTLHAIDKHLRANLKSAKEHAAH